MLLVCLLLVASLPLLTPLMLLASLLLLLVRDDPCMSAVLLASLQLLTVAVSLPWILAVAVLFAAAACVPSPYGVPTVVDVLSATGISHRFCGHLMLQLSLVLLSTRYCCRRPWNSCWLVTLLFLPPLLLLTSHLLLVFPTFLTSLLLLAYPTVANIPDNIANAQLCKLDN